MKIQFTLLTENAVEEIQQLNTLIKEHNIKGLMTRVSTKKSTRGTMNTVEYLPIIEMVLGSTVIAAGVNGLFSIVKSYFETRKEERVAQTNADKDLKVVEINAKKELDIAKINAQKELDIVNCQEDTKNNIFEIAIEVDGKELSLKCNEANYLQSIEKLQQQLLEAPENND